MQEHPYSMAIHLGLIHKRHTRIPISQFLFGKGLSAYFLCIGLRVWFLISLPLGTDHHPPLWDSEGLWHILKCS